MKNNHFGLTDYRVSFLSGNPVALNCTQDARAELIKEQHDGNPIFDHKMWMFKPLW